MEKAEQHIQSEDIRNADINELGKIVHFKAWKEFCKKGRYSQRNREDSVKRCIDMDGVVRGYYSDIPLNPTLPQTDAMYPSHDHLTHPKDDSKMVIDARVINDVKSILNEQEFWSLIEHLYAVGRVKGKIPDREAKRQDGWKPKRDYSGGKRP